MSHKSNLVDVEVHLHFATGKAFKVSLSGDEDDAVWVPKSQSLLDAQIDEVGTLSLPEWLAQERGLI